MMATQLYVNLPVRDLEKSKRFFGSLGFDFNQRFTDQNAACMIVGPDSFVMLLTEEFFKKFTPKPVADAAGSTEVLVAFSVESRAKVDEMVGRAIASGAVNYAEPQDHDFMYQHGFQDLDGHLWEICYVDESAVEKN